jgi:hypothetical protein
MIKLALGMALILAVALPAAAQVKSDTAPERFDAADTNDDGKVDRTEYEGFVAELVLIHDADRDSKLSRDEVATAPDPSKFDQIDADRDGLLTAAEIGAFTQNDFAVMDGNQDGSIDRDEAGRHK